MSWKLIVIASALIFFLFLPVGRSFSPKQSCQVNTNLSRDQFYSSIKGVIMDVNVQADCGYNPSFLAPMITLSNTRPAMYVVDVYPSQGGSYSYTTSVFVDANGQNSFSQDLNAYNGHFKLKMDVEVAVGVYVTQYVLGNVLGFSPSDDTLWRITQEIKQEYMPNTPYLMTSPSDWVNDFANYMNEHPDEFVQVAAESGQSYSQGYFLGKVSAVFGLASTMSDTINLIETELNSPFEETVFLDMTESTSNAQSNQPPSFAGGSYISPTYVAAGGTITAYYYITNPNSYSIQVGLGMSIRPSGTDNEISNPANDITVTVSPGTNVYSRTFNVPTYTSAGNYEWILAIWSGSPGSSNQYDNTGWQGGLSVASY